MIPAKTLKEINQRSEGLCENCGRPAADIMHIEHRKMGGRHGIWEKIINDPRNLAAGCRGCHDLIDLHRKQLFPGERDKALEIIKAKTNWYEWEQEHKG